MNAGIIECGMFSNSTVIQIQDENMHLFRQET